MTQIFGTAIQRAAEAMMRALGGSEISLLLPILLMPDDPGAQLGLVDPGVEEVRLSPVVIRNLPTENAGPRRRLEFLIPATIVAVELRDRNVASAQALFGGALGINYDNELFHMESFLPEYFGGMTYLYRVMAVE
jgi:hypothetical protein